MVNRRKLITGLISFAAVAPAIVRPENIMKVQSFRPDEIWQFTEYGYGSRPDLDLIEYMRLLNEARADMFRVFFIPLERLMTVHRLPGSDNTAPVRQPHETSIEILKELLADALAGKVQGIVCVWVDGEGEPQREWSDIPAHCTVNVIGGLAVAQAEMTKEITEGI